MNVSAGESKVQCYKEQYCLGIWNVRSVNQGKLQVVKEMAKDREAWCDAIHGAAKSQT